jgi:glutathione S-transferase
MKLLSDRMGTNPRRVILYLREKGLQIERVDVDTAAGEHKQPAFLARNPAGQIPVLQLDDGSYLSESAAIVEYLEELHPEPAMIGTTPASRARVRALERIGTDLICRTGILLFHSHPHFASRCVQQPAVAEAVRPLVSSLLVTLERHIGMRSFLAGEQPTIADCTVFSLFQTCRHRLKLDFGAEYPQLNAWYGRFVQRPSAAYEPAPAA